MIVKVKSYKKPAFATLISYILDETERLYDQNNQSFIITHNLRGKNPDKWAQQFKENETHRLRKRTNSVYLYHEILSWHKDDVPNISLEKMQDMVREYLHLRNPNGMYVAIPHFDRDHYHVHICASAIEYKTGKSMRISRQEFSELKQKIQNYQQEQFPELASSVVRHGRKKKGIASEKEYQSKARTGKITKREELLSIIDSCYTRSSSQKDFFERLKTAGIETYVRGGKVTGVVYAGRKFRFKRLGVEVGNIEVKENELAESRQNINKRRQQRFR